MVDSKPKRTIRKKTEPSYAIYISKLHKDIHGAETELTLSSGAVVALESMAEYSIDVLTRNSRLAMNYAGGKTLSTPVLQGAATLMLSGKLRDESPAYAAAAVGKLSDYMANKPAKKK